MWKSFSRWRQPVPKYEDFLHLRFLDLSGILTLDLWHTKLAASSLVGALHWCCDIKQVTTCFPFILSGSKFAAYGYAEALADELRKHYKKSGVHSSIVFPAFANTNLVHQHDNRINYKAG